MCYRASPVILLSNILFPFLFSHQFCPLSYISRSEETTAILGQWRNPEHHLLRPDQVIILVYFTVNEVQSKIYKSYIAHSPHCFPLPFRRVTSKPLSSSLLILHKYYYIHFTSLRNQTSCHNPHPPAHSNLYIITTISYFSLSLLNLFFIFYYLYITSRSSLKILHLRKSSQPYSGQCHLSLIIFNYILFLFHISSLLFISVLLFSITTTISSIPISSILYFLFIIIYTTFIILLIYSLTHIFNHS